MQETTTPVIGIDPGPREFAWVLWDGSRVLDCGDVQNYQPGAFLTPFSNHRWAALAVAVTAFDLEQTDHEATFHRMTGT